MMFVIFFFEGYGEHRDLHVLTHSFPTRRSSDLTAIYRHGIPVLPACRHAGHPDAHATCRRREQPDRARAVQPVVHDARHGDDVPVRSEEHTSELQSLMRISYAVFCLKKKNITNKIVTHTDPHIELCHSPT